MSEHEPLVVSVLDHRRYEALLDEEVGLLQELRELEPGTVEQRAAVRPLHAVAARQARLLADLGFLEDGL